jgi:hypothetical protein
MNRALEAGFSRFVDPQQPWSRPGDRNITVNSTQAANANIGDIILPNTKEGYQVDNLVWAIANMTFAKMAMLNLQVLPIRQVRSEEMTKRYTKIIFNPELATIIGPRGRVPNVSYRTIEKKLTSFTFGLGWNAQMIAAQQTITLPNGEKPNLLQLFLRHCKLSIETTLQIYTLEALIDCEKRTNKGLMENYANLTLEKFYKNRHAAFGLFNKAKNAGLVAFTELSSLINDEIKINGGIPPNTLIVRDDLALHIAVENPTLVRHHVSGDFGIERILETKERLNDSYFSIVLNNDPNGMVIPIKDLEARLKVYGSSFMEEDTTFGEWYPIDGRPGRWGSDSWDPSFQEIQLYDGHNRKKFRVDLMRCIRESPVWNANGSPKLLDKQMSDNDNVLRDADDRQIDLFQDEDGDAYTLFGEWPQTHFSTKHLALWTREVIKNLRKRDPEVIRKFQSVSYKSPDFDADEDAYNDLMGLIGTSFQEAIELFTDRESAHRVLVGGQRFLVRDTEPANAGRTDLTEIVTSLYLLFASVVVVDPNTPIAGIVAPFIQKTKAAPTMLDDYLTLMAFAHFNRDHQKIAVGDPFDKTVIDTYLAVAKDDNKNVTDAAIEKVKRTYRTIWDTVAAKVTDPKDDAKSLAEITALLPMKPAKFAIITKTYEDLVSKSENWNGFPWTPTMLNDRDVLMTLNDLKEFIKTHGSVFKYRQGEFIEGKLPTFSYGHIGAHFEQMKTNNTYRDKFLASIHKIADPDVLNFLTDNQLIGGAIGGKFKPEFPAVSKTLDEVTVILARTGTVFLDNWNTICTTLHGLELFIAKLFMLTPISLPALERWNLNEFPLPFAGVVLRDWVVATADFAIACRRGEQELGVLQVANFEYAEYNDGQTHTQGGTFNVTAGAMIMHEENVVVLPAIHLREFKRGYGSETLKPEQRTNNNCPPTASLTFHLVPIGAQIPNMWSTTGNLSNDNILAQLNLEECPSVPCGKRLYQNLNMQQLIRMSDIQRNPLNTVVARGKTTFTEDGHKFDCYSEGYSGMGDLDGIPSLHSRAKSAY